MNLLPLGRESPACKAPSSSRHVVSPGQRSPLISSVVSWRKTGSRGRVRPRGDDFQDTEAGRRLGGGQRVWPRRELPLRPFQVELISRVAGGAHTSRSQLIGRGALCLRPVSAPQLNSHHPTVRSGLLLPRTWRFCLGLDLGVFVAFSKVT